MNNIEKVIKENYYKEGYDINSKDGIWVKASKTIKTVNLADKFCDSVTTATHC